MTEEDFEPKGTAKSASFADASKRSSEEPSEHPPIPFADPDFDSFLEGNKTTLKCRHCRSVMESSAMEQHKAECPPKRG